MNPDRSPDDEGSVLQSPRIQDAELLEPAELQAVINLLRRFHLGEPVAAASTPAPDEHYLPLLLNNFRTVRRFRYEYPLLLIPDDSGELLAISLEEFLEDALPSAEGSARILKDNIAWLDSYVREQLSGQDFASPAKDLMIDAGHSLQSQIGLNQSSQEILQAGIDELIDKIPRGGQLLPYGRNVALHLLQHVIRHRTQSDRENLMRRISQAIRGLQQLLEIEQDKTASGEISGEGSRYFNSPSMNDVLEHRSRGSILMEPQRLKRIASALKILTEVELQQNVLTLVVRSGDFSFGDSAAIEIVESADPCGKSLELYNLNANRLSKVYACLRTAELEISNTYDTKFHDSWFDSFDFDAFSDAEKQMIPSVVVIESAERLMGSNLQSFSSLLSSGRPVQILININPLDNLSHMNSSPGPEAGLQVDLATLGIGHRHALINQVSAANYQALLSGFSSALAADQSCLHLIHSGYSDPQLLHPWIMAGAAVESRAHPFIRFDPTISESAPDITFTENPCAQQDWAANTVSCTNDAGEPVETEYAFTFADYCLLKPELRDHYRLIPDGCETDELVAIDTYLNASEGGRDRLIPFIWSVDQTGVMKKLVVSRRLVFACRDRLKFWRSLQSMAGIRNVYVDEAIRNVREEEQQQAAAEREEILAQHEELLNQVRTEATSEVMGKLTDVLLGLDLSDGYAVARSPSIDTTEPADTTGEVHDLPPAIETEGEIQTESIVQEEDEDEISFDEPWIDSIFCTTCDDCLVLNKQMFVYNDNRQAIISDPNLGTYSQLVEAAELCPARCIHPGKPLDSAEPGLDDLIKRAEPYN